MKFHSNDRATPRESKSQSMGDRGVGGEGGERAKAEISSLISLAEWTVGMVKK